MTLLKRPALVSILAACSSWRASHALSTKATPIEQELQADLKVGAGVAAGFPGVAASFPGVAVDAGAVAEVSEELPPVAVPLQCDVEASGAVCFGGGQIMVGPALPHGLVGYWSFDKSSVMDSSGSGNHGMMTVKAGPALGGQGSSAAFHQNFLVIPGDKDSLFLHEQSVSFWVYLIDSGHVGEKATVAPAGADINASCPFVRKGLDSRASFPEDDGRAEYAAAPAILFDRRSRKIRVELETIVSPGLPSGAEVFESNARLSAGRWFHVALVHIDTERRTRLYVNGILDASLSTRGWVKPNRQPIYVGGDPATMAVCDVSLYVDELKIYNRRLDPDEIQAEASPALQGVEPSFIRLACTDCTLEMAVTNCPDTYHICSSLELHMGGYQVAHTMGWLKRGGHVWSHAPAAAGGTGGQQGDHVSPGMGAVALASMHVTTAPASGLGLGLCCADGA